MLKKRAGSYWMESYRLEKYLFDSLRTLGANKNVLIIVGITMSA